MGEEKISFIYFLDCTVHYCMKNTLNLKYILLTHFYSFSFQFLIVFVNAGYLS